MRPHPRANSLAALPRLTKQRAKVVRKYSWGSILQLMTNRKAIYLLGRRGCRTWELRATACPQYMLVPRELLARGPRSRVVLCAVESEAQRPLVLKVTRLGCAATTAADDQHAAAAAAAGVPPGSTAAERALRELQLSGRDLGPFVVASHGWFLGQARHASAPPHPPAPPRLCAPRSAPDEYPPAPVVSAPHTHARRSRRRPSSS